jgi:hypothetical protein
MIVLAVCTLIVANGFDRRGRLDKLGQCGTEGFPAVNFLPFLPNDGEGWTQLEVCAYAVVLASGLLSCMILMYRTWDDTYRDDSPHYIRTAQAMLAGPTVLWVQDPPVDDGIHVPRHVLARAKARRYIPTDA